MPTAKLFPTLIQPRTQLQGMMAPACRLGLPTSMNAIRTMWPTVSPEISKGGAHRSRPTNYSVSARVMGAPTMLSVLSAAITKRGAECQ